MREVVSSIELGKSYGPYRLPQEVAAAPPTQTIPHPSPAAVAAHMAAPLTAADFGDSVQGVSGVSGVPGVSDVPPAKHRKQSSGTPPGTLRPDWGTSTALRGCIAGDGALQMMDSQNFTSCHQSKPL